MRRFIFTATACFLLSGASLFAHCQMPCGIYHDDMVYDQIDQYVETMVKGVAKIKDNKFSTPAERNEGVRWIMTKDRISDDTAQLITGYFLQQKIKPGEPDSIKRIESAHKMLFLIVGIKQSVDFKSVSDFAEEWEKFKLMFHFEGYECAMEQKEAKALLEKQKAAEEKEKAANGNSKEAPDAKANTAPQSRGAKSGT